MYRSHKGLDILIRESLVWWDLGLPLLVVPLNVNSVHKIGGEAGDEDVEQFGGVVAVGRVVIGLQGHQQTVQVVLALTTRAESVDDPLGDRAYARRSTDPVLDVNPRPAIRHR